MTPVAADGVSAACAYVSMSAVRHNVQVVRDTIGEQVRICAVLKADAYGHGAANIARELAGSGVRRQPLVDAVAVATFEEAEHLGRMSVPVYVMRPIESMNISAERKRLEEAIRLGWVMPVSSAAAARDLARVAQSMRGVPALVHVALDTGMARAGVPVEQFDEVAQAVMGYPSLRLTSLSTHFVMSEDGSGPMTGEQFAQFTRATDRYVATCPGLVRHAANSGGIFFHRHTHLDMVRPGKAIYGIDPSGRPSDERGLRPILKWVAPLLMVRDLKRGQTVGYGATFTAERDMRVGLVPVGFADGYMRCLSGKGSMLVNGHAAPVVGRISMDYTTIDVSGVPDVAVGDTVTIIDDRPNSPASIYNLARLADTIPSELLCGVGARIPRVAVGQECPVVNGLIPRVPRERGRRLRAAG